VDFLGLAALTIKPPFAPVLMMRGDYSHFPDATPIA